MGDPWDWDVDRVVQEFCTANRSWHPSSTPLKLPPLDQLEEAIREHQVDGEVLLTYDQAELCKDLGIKILKHKSTFKNAIQNIRLLSSRYRVHRKRQASEFEDTEDSTSGAEVLDVVQVKDASKGQINEIRPEGTSSEHVLASKGSDVTVANEQPAKRRKITPTLITTSVDPNRNRKIPTEADTVFLTPELRLGRTEAESAHELSHALGNGAYLGGKSVTRFDIVDFDAFNEPYSSPDGDKQLNIVSTSRLIPGRMIQTHRWLKRRLLRRTTSHRTGFAKSDIVPGSNDPDHEKVLPLYGDSDDDIEYDSDTWREIEAEQIEKDQKSLPQGLTTEEIGSTIDRVIKEMVSEWRSTKLPKYTSKANRIWNDARKSGLKEAMDRARRELRRLDTRIEKLIETTHKNEYRNVKELEPLLSNFEVSVCDREYHLWLVDLLTSPSEPTKVKQHNESAKRPPKQQLDLAEDEEILTSESEDLNDFIVDDFNDDDDEHPFVTDNDQNEPDQNEVMSSRTPETPSRIRFAKVPEKTAGMTPKETRPVVIDLTTPPNPKRHIIRLKDGRLSSTVSTKSTQQIIASSPLMMPVTDLESAEQKVATTLETVDQTYIDAIFSIIRCCEPQDVWLDLVAPALEREWPIAPYNTHIKKDGLSAYTLIRLFETYRDGVVRKLKRYRNADEKQKARIRGLYKDHSQEWDAFIKFLRRLSDRFEWHEIDTENKKSRPSTSLLEAESEEEMDPGSLSEVTDDDPSQDDADGPQSDKKRKKKRRPVLRNREAAMARGRDQAFAKEQESRRKQLRERLATLGSTALGSQHGRLIVNESKDNDQGFIYINDDIAYRIKQHQIEGVRFMWDQIVVAKERQGCLLAHTMGLGKTMQVITLLVTINEASRSDDPTVVAQIPEEMRRSQTLILCPATLVNNWMDEILTWLPQNHGLGNLLKVDAVMGGEDRIRILQKWAGEGGILIIGYHLFKIFVEDGVMRDTLLEQPNIIIADEAHMMKNPKSSTHIATAKFKSLSRVALTGSPLANNVEEYYAMINWVAPNYLGDIREFRSEYANPIKDGLQAESTTHDRRRALRMLRVLKSEVAAKVSRKTIAVLKQGIPDKTEFVITVPLTPVQRQAYEMFIEFHRNGQSESSKVPQFAIHDLGLICASPLIFMEKLKEKLKSKGNKSSNKTETSTLPQQLVSDEMTLLRSAMREVKDDITLSWKVLLLLEILHQCKEVGDHVLLFSHSKVALDYLENVLHMKRHSFMRLDGDTEMSERQNRVKRFNKGSKDIFLISTKAGALGLNITGANRVIIFDAQFNPQNEQQAVGRAYRIGQTKPVYVYRFVCGGTCEEKLLHQAIWKIQLASRVVDKKNFVKKAPQLARVWDMPDEPKQEELDHLLGKDVVLDALLRDKDSRQGLRAIQMMDVFEEEAVEDAELLPEDISLANNIIQANEARRTGQPVPAHVSAALAELGAISYGYDIISSVQTVQSIPPLMMPLMGHGSHDTRPPSSLTPMQLQGAEVHIRHSASNPNIIPRQNYDEVHTSQDHQHVPQQDSSNNPLNGVQTQQDARVLSNPSISRNSETSVDPKLNSLTAIQNPTCLLPVQLRGAEVHIRSPVMDSNAGPDTADPDWTSLATVQTDLDRAFHTVTSFPDQQTRSRVSLDVSKAIWDAIQHVPVDDQVAMKWAVKRAVSHGRFVEGICMGLISLRTLGQLTPAGIDRQVKMWKAEAPSVWEKKRRAWITQSPSRDPEHLQNALHRLSVAAHHDAATRHPDDSKSYRLDDHEALQAVFDRRQQKVRRLEDQEAVRAVAERRKAKESPTQSSEANKNPRLPRWAKDVVRQAHIPAPSSSVPPRASPPPLKGPHRPQPRTPFK
ncbi:hypothetical protein F5Y08DRAFT_64500 [Xylaria arbuscula]|nr:hypothetical protein F5Y08DRAFT_64500 [Xylaria arbuscula]